MKAVAINAYGGVEKLELMELPIPKPKKGEVLINIMAAGVNAVDSYFRDGYMGTNDFPVVMGSDFAGIITELGDGVEGFAVGDEVYGYKYLGNGTYAEYAVVDAELVAKKPRSINFEEAAVLPCAGLIAYETVAEVLQLTKGETLLITGVTGGVGMFATQIAKYRGAVVIGVGDKQHEQFAKSFGVDHFIDSNDGDYVEMVRAAYPDGVDAALPAYSKSVSTIIKAVRDGGRMTWITGPQRPELERGITGSATNGSRGTRLLKALAKLVDDGGMPTIHIDTSFSLESTADAQTLSTSGGVLGKIVIVI